MSNKTLKMYDRVRTPFGYTHEELAPTTVFVTGDNDMIYVNPEIIESDDDCVVFLDNRGNECMGTAVTMATMTLEEALYIARRGYGRILKVNGLSFEWSAPTRRSPSEWCVGFRKQRGTRTHLLKLESMEQALELAQGTKTIRYWTNSRRASIVAA